MLPNGPGMLLLYVHCQASQWKLHTRFAVVVQAVGAPVLHANADDPEAVVIACEVAADWRSQWRRDIVVDLVGYRRHVFTIMSFPLYPS